MVVFEQIENCGTDIGAKHIGRRTLALAANPDESVGTERASRNRRCEMLVQSGQFIAVDQDAGNFRHAPRTNAVKHANHLLDP